MINHIHIDSLLPTEMAQKAEDVGLRKANLDFLTLFFLSILAEAFIGLGVICNALVCLAVWLTFSAGTTTDKILAILFPITAFVAAGTEHSVANMYFIPIGLIVKNFGGAAFFENT
ncbi:MAG: hypothetical protein CVU41_07550 [Chloroflexi bacterium HGW-Chloroflexi-3]|nr:MAG: hypothetical protein CVU41_07550 [Chloroflexi bacterium HGW-Chloroflexi-3]